MLLRVAVKIKSNHSPKLNNTMFDPQWAYGKYEKKKNNKKQVFSERERKDAQSYSCSENI